jgi:hypothetical protein
VQRLSGQTEVDDRGGHPRVLQVVHRRDDDAIGQRIGLDDVMFVEDDHDVGAVGGADEAAGAQEFPWQEVGPGGHSDLPGAP